MYEMKWKLELKKREEILKREREMANENNNNNNDDANGTDLELKTFALFCMDTYVPSVTTNEIVCRTCKDCGQYLQSKAMLRDHRRACHPRRRIRG